MKPQRLIFAFALLMVFGVLLTMGVHAQVTGSTSSAVPVDLTEKVAIVAGIVAAVLQGVKKFIPSIGGSIAVLLNVILSLSLTYAAHPSLDVQYFITSLGAALSAAGIHSFLRPNGVSSTAAPLQPGKGS